MVLFLRFYIDIIFFLVRRAKRVGFRIISIIISQKFDERNGFFKIVAEYFGFFLCKTTNYGATG